MSEFASGGSEGLVPSEPSSSVSSSAEAVPVPPDEFDLALPAPLRPAAVALFGDRLELAERFATLLGTDGVVRG